MNKELAHAFDMEQLRHTVATLRAAEFSLVGLEANFRGRGNGEMADALLAGLEALGLALYSEENDGLNGLETLLPENKIKD